MSKPLSRVREGSIEYLRRVREDRSEGIKAQYEKFLAANSKRSATLPDEF